MEIDNIVKAKSNKHKQQQDIKQNHFSCSLWCLLCFLRILKEEKVHFLDPPCVLVLGTSSRPAKCEMQKKSGKQTSSNLSNGILNFRALFSWITMQGRKNRVIYLLARYLLTAIGTYCTLLELLLC